MRLFLYRIFINLRENRNKGEIKNDNLIYIGRKSSIIVFGTGVFNHITVCSLYIQYKFNYRYRLWIRVDGQHNSETQYELCTLQVPYIRASQQ